MEESIQLPEPEGLGIPVILILIDGGITSIIKINMALKRGIPIVVLHGTGRAADIVSYAVSLTVPTPK